MKKALPDGRYRIIKISRDAVYEAVREEVKDHLEDFFDVSDCTKYISHHNMDFETGEYICCVENFNGTLASPPEIDIEKLLENMEDTTNSLYNPGRYAELSLEEITAIQNKSA